MTFKELEAEFLNSDGPEMEQMENAKTEADAAMIGTEFLEGKKYNMKDLYKFIAKIRKA